MQPRKLLYIKVLQNLQATFATWPSCHELGTELEKKKHTHTHTLATALWVKSILQGKIGVLKHATTTQTKEANQHEAKKTLLQHLQPAFATWTSCHEALGWKKHKRAFCKVK